MDVHLIIILILSTGSKDLETEETDQVTLFKVIVFNEMIFEYKYRCTFSGGFFSLVALLTVSVFNSQPQQCKKTYPGNARYLK